MKKHKKKLALTQEDNQDFKNPTKCWIYDKNYVKGDAKVTDQCHITGKYRKCT